MNRWNRSMFRESFLFTFYLKYRNVHRQTNLLLDSLPRFPWKLTHPYPPFHYSSPATYDGWISRMYHLHLLFGLNSSSQAPPLQIPDNWICIPQLLKSKMQYHLCFDFRGSPKKLLLSNWTISQVQCTFQFV